MAYVQLIVKLGRDLAGRVSLEEAKNLVQTQVNSISDMSNDEGGANVEILWLDSADELKDLSSPDFSIGAFCKCTTEVARQPMKHNGCTLHKDKAYPCMAECAVHCKDYRPQRLRKSSTDWPVCVCGHVAEAHN